MRRARALWDECAACGGPPSNVHHVLQKGSPHFGDDVIENFLLLCGTGTTGCHGAWHGSPYIAYVKPIEGLPRQERRDQAWVAGRAGRYIVRERPDTILYVIEKLGLLAAGAFLERDYRIDLADVLRVHERVAA